MERHHNWHVACPIMFSLSTRAAQKATSFGNLQFSQLTYGSSLYHYNANRSSVNCSLGFPTGAPSASIVGGSADRLDRTVRRALGTPAMGKSTIRFFTDYKFVVAL